MVLLALTALLWSRTELFLGLVVILTLIGCFEWSNLTGGWPPFLALMAGGLFLGPVYSPQLLLPSRFLTLEATALAAYILTGLWTWFAIKTKQRLGLMGGLAAAWITIPAINLVLIQNYSKLSHDSALFFLPLALVALLPVWAGDSAAYLVGRRYGKHPLAPQISPNKTIEGALAHIMAATLLGIASAFLLHLGSKPGLTVAVGIGLGLISGIASILGDLLESGIKRAANVKDSGNLLPGHGGILDRIDGMLASSVAVGTALAALVTFGIVSIHG